MEIKNLLKYIDPSTLDYQSWVNVGMALKHEGGNVWDWDQWSAKDSNRYVPGECIRKWDTFNEDSGSIVTGGTIYQMAVEGGYMPPEKGQWKMLDWDDEISDDYLVVDKSSREREIIHIPQGDNWNPSKEIIRYLETLFNYEDIVGYVTQAWETDKGKYAPTQGIYNKTAGSIIEELKKTTDIGSVLGDYNKEVGAWIRFNPLDGQGCKDRNVVSYKYALVECDNIEPERQIVMIKELKLPVAIMVYSGKKSVHAIVRVDATDQKEYAKRVDYLYKICKKNGLTVDTQNKNPARLSRFPGFERGEKKQFIIDTHLGFDSWNEWEEWIESVNDDLPEPEPLTETFWNLPPLKDELIKGVLRCGHKLLISGPSKAGKSFGLIELTIALAEGDKWFGFDCKRCKVMYVNLELDRTSCLHRFRDVYASLGLSPKNLSNIDIWNLRGKSIPMDKLAPKLIRRASKKDYGAIIIDPIYKVITGDENSADQMARFCNQFDLVCTELGCSVIYCHHHSKGAQGGKKAVDRASGSGVFARDPDAIFDLIELEVPESVTSFEENQRLCKELIKFFESHGKGNLIDDENRYQYNKILEVARLHLKAEYDEILALVRNTREKVKQRSAWRLDGTLREFGKFAPVNMWFEYPVHVIDESKMLKDLQADADQQWQRGLKKAYKKAEKDRDKKKTKIDNFIDMENYGDEVTVNDLATKFEIPKSTARSWVEQAGYKVENGVIKR